MNTNKYYIISIFSFFLTVLFIILIFYDKDRQSIYALIAGGFLSLTITVLIQTLASSEQTEMIKSVTLDAQGIENLPEPFRNLKWIAYATKIPAEDSSQTKWKFDKLKKVGGSGPRFLTYSLRTKNLLDEEVEYKATFVGGFQCVTAAVSSGHEATSMLIFDCSVPAAGIYFGTAYLTDWINERDVTLIITGTTEINSLEELPARAKASFKQWFKNLDITIEDAYKTFPFDERST